MNASILIPFNFYKIKRNFTVHTSFDMDSLTLSGVLSRDPYTKHCFIGCFPSDKLPIPAEHRSPFCFIVNVDKSDEPGSHWFAVYVKRTAAFIFDSFGTVPSVIKRWCRALGRPVYFNSTPHQAIDEVTCGGYAVYALCELARRKRFSTVMNRFLNTRYDDAFIRAYLARVHGVQIPQTMPN